jgi:hypothetical protein
VKFEKGEIICREDLRYPEGALVCDGYNDGGRLLAHPLGGDFQLTVPAQAEPMFRAVAEGDRDEAERRSRGVMIGIFEGFNVTHDSFGQQYTKIEGRHYITFFDLMDPNLRGLMPGVVVEFEVRDAQTKLCDRPLVTEALPTAKLLRVIRGR